MDICTISHEFAYPLTPMVRLCTQLTSSWFIIIMWRIQFANPVAPVSFFKSRARECVICYMVASNVG